MNPFVIEKNIRDFLVNRPNELNEIVNSFSHDYKFVIVVGPPGVGKTTLLKLFIRKYRKKFRMRPS